MWHPEMARWSFIRRFGPAFARGSLVLMLGVILWLTLSFEPAPSAQAYFYQYGENETGAINLVTAIYLGYRAFDTLGETIVLLLAVSGVLVLTGAKS